MARTILYQAHTTCFLLESNNLHLFASKMFSVVYHLHSIRNLNIFVLFVLHGTDEFCIKLCVMLILP